MRRTCTHPSCNAAASGGRCQDCHKAFCREHVDATEFDGPRRYGATATNWTRFVCEACARRTHRQVADAAARMARDQALREAQGTWWEAPRP